MIQGEYHLHENGNLIYKPHGDVDRDSHAVIEVWLASCIGRTPQSFCEWLKQAFELGANKERILELGNKNKLDEYIPEWKEIVGVL
jgi:hypothetical protein